MANLTACKLCDHFAECGGEADPQQCHDYKNETTHSSTQKQTEDDAEQNTSQKEQ